ncbi:hypothetical protein FYK55_13580 [Roseiconus nitratireducens]|uniref:Alpha/beta hydrolase n=1 Tax=Roseiconus nitratireducens TaxID=2605748 RepID=A0A5M6D7D3_9BACT|nr:hypothetical protein [Roseiconus nitratireducens]KAA5542566.1 hypothetical protein FYK55_13580 [Roseiconus nitratireducens]
MTGNGTREDRIGRIILVPGLFEPRVAFAPLRHRLRRNCRRVEYFPDRVAFRSLEQSVQRMINLIRPTDDDDAIGIVTHSFGDWVTRQALARSEDHAVTRLVSVAPVMRSGLIPIALHACSGNLIPEIRVMMDSSQAAANLDCGRTAGGGDRVKRLVIWAKADESVRPVSLEHLSGIRVERVAATHLTVIIQPNVLKMIERFLFPDGIPDRRQLQDGENPSH